MFDANADTETGKKYIGELILPRAATAIADGTKDKFLFKDFENLQAVSGGKITSIGEFAFAGCGALASADIPKAASIGGGKFHRIDTVF